MELWGGVASFSVEEHGLVITAPAWYVPDIEKFTRVGSRWRDRFPVRVVVVAK